MGAKEANKRRPEAQKGVAHVARYRGRVGPTIWSLAEALQPLTSREGKPPEGGAETRQGLKTF